jgi:hypothetical protein
MSEARERLEWGMGNVGPSCKRMLDTLLEHPDDLLAVMVEAGALKAGTALYGEMSYYRRVNPDPSKWTDAESWDRWEQ